MPTIGSESILWYNVGQFGAAGYAVPNWGENIGSINTTILNLVETVGRNLFSFLHHEDVDLRVPPSINSIKRLFKLIARVRSVIGARAIPPGVDNMESVHASPAPEAFLVFPAPFFKVRNTWMKAYAQLVFDALCEMMQHTENRKSFEISNDFGGLVGMYFNRISRLCAVEVLGIDQARGADPSFLPTDADYSAYNPSKYFTSTELVDTVSPFSTIFTAQQLQILGNGILTTNMPICTPYPSMLTLASGTGQATPGEQQLDPGTQPAVPTSPFNSGTAAAPGAATAPAATAANPPAFPPPPAP